MFIFQSLLLLFFFFWQLAIVKNIQLQIYRPRLILRIRNDSKFGRNKTRSSQKRLDSQNKGSKSFLKGLYSSATIAGKRSNQSNRPLNFFRNLIINYR